MLTRDEDRRGGASAAYFSAVEVPDIRVTMSNLEMKCSAFSAARRADYFEQMPICHRGMDLERPVHVWVMGQGTSG